MKILLIRGAFLNNYEGQNYKDIAKNHDFTAISSLAPIHTKLPFAVKRFFAPYDVGIFLGRIHPVMGRIVNFINNRLFGDGQFLLGFENFVRQTGPYDVVIGAETYFGYDMQIARLRSEGHIKKFVSFCWEIIPHNNETVLKKKRIKAEVMKYVDIYVCPTNLAKKTLQKEGVSDNKIKVIGVGVDQSRFKPMKNFSKNIITVLFVGRMVQEKGVKDLPEIFRQIRQKYIGDKMIRFRVVGSGPLGRWIESKLGGLNATIETIEYGEMPKVYQSATVLVVPSRTTLTWAEQYGMVIAEAQSCGVPVVGYDSGAIAEVVGAGGIVIKEGDIDSMSKVIVELIDNSQGYTKLVANTIDHADANFNQKKFAVLLQKAILDY